MSVIQTLKRFFQKPKPVIRLKPDSPSRGVVSFSYITWPFLEGIDSKKMMGHTNPFECTTMAETFRQLGFEVHIVDYHNTDYVPPANCRVAIDIHSNLELWAKHLPADCQKILHVTGPHWLFWNHAELSRLLSVQNRKGVALTPRRPTEASRSIEVANVATVLGNQFTMDTFKFAGNPIKRIPISSAYEFAWPEGRDFEKARKKFLWVGSYGMVHKGLDLVLDAFAQMPEFELTICGRPEKEPDFFKAYEKEIKHTANIHYYGWLDMASPGFLELARTHAAIVYPSCAEGGAGSVIHCMHAGLMPIVTTEASIDIKDFGMLIENGDVDSVIAAVRKFAMLPTSEIETRARASYDHVRAAHTRAKFQENFAAFARELTAGM